jgi:hypothetical protein
VATGLIPGQTYKFKVQSRNAFGFSDYSTILSVLSAFVPEKPSAPVSAISTNTVVITWSAPFDNGSVITHYTVEIRDSTSTFRTETTGCNGADATIVAT